ncbi:MAG: hypothetical protein H7831_06590 [Magnetococcus sp. WYHC-3]
MDYEIQKVIFKNCTVYNILHESNILGHVIQHENSNVLIQTDELPIIPLAESFGFQGHFYLATEDGYQSVNLNPTSEFKPLYEFKVINLEDHLLTESEL